MERYSNTETTPSRELCLFSMPLFVISYLGQRLERGFFLAFHHYLDSAFDEYGVPHFHCIEELSSELLNNRGNGKSELVARCLDLSLIGFERVR